MTLSRGQSQGQRGRGGGGGGYGTRSGLGWGTVATKKLRGGMVSPLPLLGMKKNYLTIINVLSIKHLANQDSGPTTPHKLETATKPLVSSLFYYLHVLYKRHLHMLT